MAPALAPAFIAVVDGAEVHAPSASQGLVMANSLCSSCHLVADRPGSVAIEGIPSFVSIANRPGQTRERIIAKLIQPHAPMPAVPLTTDNMLDIIAYLETLRTNNANPPLIEPGRPKLPEKLPAPS